MPPKINLLRNKTPVKDVNWDFQHILESIITTTKTLWSAQENQLEEKQEPIIVGEESRQPRSSRNKVFAITLLIAVTGLVTDWSIRLPSEQLKRVKIEKQELEWKYKQALSSIFSCANEEGFTVSMSGGGQLMDAVSVRCTRVGEWRVGQYYHYVRGKPVLNGDRFKIADESSSASTGR